MLADSSTAYSNALFWPDGGPAAFAVLASKQHKMKRRATNFVFILIGLLDQYDQARGSQVKIATMPNTERIAITLQKICNLVPLDSCQRQRTVYSRARQIAVTRWRFISCAGRA